MTEGSEYNKLRLPLISILITILIVFLGFQIIGPVIGMIVAYPLFPGTLEEFEKAFTEPFKYPEFRSSLLIMQGFGTLFGMIVIPYFFLKKQDRSLSGLFSAPFYVTPAFMVFLLVIVFMGFNSLFIEWNQNVDLPDFMERWARETEDKLAQATKFLTEFDSPGYFFLVFIVIAVLPAIGEEIVFRGMIQNDLYRSTRNIHISIWVAAILFSAIHIQFYGFVPRMLLGALFGYLYYWSGNLWLAVLAHFVNNGFTVVALYLYQRKMIPVDIEDTASTPWQAVAFSAVFSAFLLYAYKNFYNRHPKTDIPD